MIVISVLFILVVLILLIAHLRYPLFFFHESPQVWSVGFGHLTHREEAIKPTHILNFMKAKELSGADFIADPFLFKEKGRYYLFVEAGINNFGRIDAFSSNDLADWKYEGIAMNKEYHLSYPFVFKHHHNIYMIPEEAQSHRVTLYRSVGFPLKWEKEKELLKGKYLDTTVLFVDEFVYLFAVDRNFRLYCFFSEDIIKGQFVEHPSSPLGIGDKMRPAGRPWVKGDKIVLPVQSHTRGYGTAIYSLNITKLTPGLIRYRKGKALLKPLKQSRFFRDGVHHIDMQKDDDGYVYCMDGRVGTKGRYFRGNWEKLINNNINDIKTAVTMLANNLSRTRS